MQLLCKTKNGGSSNGKPRVYFTCHPQDYGRTFEKICKDILNSLDCAIYYGENMEDPLPEEKQESDLGRMNLFVVPVTLRLLTTQNRAMDQDIAFAKEKGIPILPLMFESKIDKIYSLPENFGERQYLTPFEHDMTAISYEEKLKKFLENTLFDGKTVERIRKAFDAYIFLSYRKMDRAYANLFMHYLHSDPRLRDVAVWYDEYLTPGEAFDAEIERAFSFCKLFVMAVTPNLAKKTPDGKPNYVMNVEYPKAQNTVIESDNGEKMPIVPVQIADMSNEDLEALKEAYDGIPEIVDGRDRKTLCEVMFDNLKRFALQRSQEDLEHNYLIGLAYLKGIDVEVNLRRGLELITDSAEAGFIDAMELLADMYDNGDTVPLDHRQELVWREKIYGYYEQKLGEEHQETIKCLDNIAYTLDDIGEHEKALKLKKTAYNLRRKLLGEEHPDTLTSLHSLAYTIDIMGDYEKALELKQKAYELSCKVLGEEHPETLSSLHNLASTLSELGEHEKALELKQKVYDLRCKVLGEEHSETLTSLHNLASTLSKLGEYEQALELYQKVYDLRCKVLGEEYPETLSSLHNLAYTVLVSGKYKQALELMQKTYNLRCKVLGEEHPETLISLNNLAYTVYRSGNHEQALKLMQKVYALNCKVLGEDHPDGLISLNHIVSILLESGKYEQALEPERKYYDLSCKVRGEAHPETITGLHNLASTMYYCGKNKQALEPMQKAYDLRQNVLGEEHPDTLASLHNLALILYESGSHEKAMVLLQKAYDISRKVLGEEHPDTQEILDSLKTFTPANKRNQERNQGSIFDRAISWIKGKL